MCSTNSLAIISSNIASPLFHLFIFPEQLWNVCWTFSWNFVLSLNLSFIFPSSRYLCCIPGNFLSSVSKSLIFYSAVSYLVFKKLTEFLIWMTKTFISRNFMFYSNLIILLFFSWCLFFYNISSPFFKSLVIW